MKEQPKRAPFPADEEVFERNLAALVSRCYEPVRMEGATRRRALRAFADGCVSRAHGIEVEGAKPRRFRLVPLLLVAAAAALVIVLRAGAPTSPNEDRDAILASGRVALAPAEGPWRPATAEELARGGDGALLPLEVAVPDGARFALRFADGTVELEGRAHASFRGAPLEGILTAGTALLEREQRPGSWSLATGTGNVELVHGRLRARSDGAREEFLLEHGAAIYDGPGGRIPLEEGRGLALSAGRPVAVGPSGPNVAARSAAPSPPTPSEATRAAVPPADPAPPSGGPLVRGRALAPDGSPLERFEVALLPARRGNEYATAKHIEVHDAEGRFLWKDIDPGTYTLFLHAPGFAFTTSGPIELGETPVDVGDLRLAIGGSVRGFAVRGADGSPVADALVISEEATPQNFVPLGGLEGTYAPIRATSRADGSFLLEHLTPGTHHLRIGAPGYAPSWSEAIVVEEGRVAELGTIELTEGGAVAGHVLDGLGEPISGALLIVTPLDQTAHVKTHFARAFTDADGAWRAPDLPPIPMLVVFLGREGRDVPRVRPVRIPRTGTLVVDFTLAASAALLEGTLLEADGSPVAGQNLALAPPDGTDDFANFDAANTDESGHFWFDEIEPGEKLLFEVSTDGSWIRLLASVTVPAVPGAPLELRRSKNVLRGRVIDGPMGTLPPPTKIEVVRLDPDTGSTVLAAGLDANEDGTFAVPHLPNGTYLVTAHPLAEGRAPASSPPIPLDGLTPEQDVELSLPD
ncbi:MAG TPA: carboxypeptidase regulatory-like domain-containing protein [Planctomycetes bacterium]|nr:carboxypeptidase regulatory-like domain-containing protein [Planctomycetota bacterium]